MSKQQPYSKDGERGVIVNVASVAACKKFFSFKFSKMMGKRSF
jgi:hypothetical protein